MLFLPSCLVIMIVIVGFSVGLYFRAAAICRLESWLTGRDIWLDPPKIDLGQHPAGTVASYSLTIRNYSGHPIEVIGVNVSCGCTKVSRIPCTIQGSDMVRVPIEIKIDGSKDIVKEQVVFIINNNGDIKKYQFIIEGAVTPAKGDVNRPLPRQGYIPTASRIPHLHGRSKARSSHSKFRCVS